MDFSIPLRKLGLRKDPPLRLGLLESTHERYKHIFSVTNSFTKFIWLHPTKLTDTSEVLAKLDQQKFIFGNPTRIISDRGTAFISNCFKDYCSKESIQHVTITAGLLRANGQVGI